MVQYNNKEVRMYNKISKGSAIVHVLTAVLLVGLMILFIFLEPEVSEAGGDLGEGIGAAFSVLFFLIGCIPLYLSAFSYTIVAVVFGSKMFKEQSRQKLISYNKRPMIAAFVLLPFFLIGLFLASALFSYSTLGMFSVLYTIVTVVAYIAGIITQIVTIAKLKKSPEEPVAE